MSFSQPKSFVARVRACREALGLSQAELAEKLPDVRQQSIDQLERGLVRRPRFLPELAEALGTNMSWLLSGLGPSDPIKPQGNSNNINVNLLQNIMQVLEVAISARALTISVSKKAHIIGCIYELMREKEKPSDNELSDVVGAVIQYDQMQPRA